MFGFIKNLFGKKVEPTWKSWEAKAKELLKVTPALETRDVVVIPKVSEGQPLTEWMAGLVRRLNVTAEDVSAVATEVGVDLGEANISLELKTQFQIAHDGKSVTEEEAVRTYKAGFMDVGFMHAIVGVACRRKMAKEWGCFRRIPTPELVVNLSIPEWVSASSYDQSAQINVPKVFQSEAKEKVRMFSLAQTADTLALTASNKPSKILTGKLEVVAKGNAAIFEGRQTGIGKYQGELFAEMSDDWPTFAAKWRLVGYQPRFAYPNKNRGMPCGPVKEVTLQVSQSIKEAGILGAITASLYFRGSGDWDEQLTGDNLKKVLGKIGIPATVDLPERVVRIPESVLRFSMAAVEGPGVWEVSVDQRVVLMTEAEANAALAVFIADCRQLGLLEKKAPETGLVTQCNSCGSPRGENNPCTNCGGV